MKVGALALVPPFAFSIGLFLIRRRLASLLRRWLTPRLPGEARYLAAPMIATAAFVMSWGYLHATSPYQVGLVPQIAFPVLIGLFTFSTVQYTPGLQRKFARPLGARDTLPALIRLVLVLFFPTLISVLLIGHAPVAFPVLKQQLIVVLSLVIGYLLLMPRRPATMPSKA